MIKQTIKQDQLRALKTGDQVRLNILRYILAKIQNQEIAKQKELTDDEVAALLQKQIKETHESLAAAEKASRQELIAQSKSELEIVSPYLPKQLSDEELKKAVEKIIKDNQELYQKNPKSIIGICMKQMKSQADSARIISTLNSLTR